MQLLRILCGNLIYNKGFVRHKSAEGEAHIHFEKRGHRTCSLTTPSFPPPCQPSSATIPNTSASPIPVTTHLQNGKAVHDRRSCPAYALASDSTICSRRLYPHHTSRLCPCIHSCPDRLDALFHRCSHGPQTRLPHRTVAPRPGTMPPPASCVASAVHLSGTVARQILAAHLAI